jgi:hypothetical protein
MLALSTVGRRKSDQQVESILTTEAGMVGGTHFDL